MVTEEQLESFALRVIENYVENQTDQAKLNDRRLLPDGACELLGCSKSTLWRYAKSGLLNPSRLGSKVYYSEREIRNLMRGGAL